MSDATRSDRPDRVPAAGPGGSQDALRDLLRRELETFNWREGVTQAFDVDAAAARLADVVIDHDHWESGWESHAYKVENERDAARAELEHQHELNEAYNQMAAKYDALSEEVKALKNALAGAVDHIAHLQAEYGALAAEVRARFRLKKVDTLRIREEGREDAIYQSLFDVFVAYAKDAPAIANALKEGP